RRRGGRRGRCLLRATAGCDGRERGGEHQVRDQSLQDASEVLDSGTKTVVDSTSHAVAAVVLRARDGRLEVLLADGALPSAPLARSESLEAALARAVDVGALAHVEQLETVVRPDGGVATAYLGLAASDAALDGDW